MNRVYVAMVVFSVVASACAPRAVLTPAELRMTAEQHDRAAALEAFHAGAGDEHASPASEHERRSAAHRAAAQSLREDEASSCGPLRKGTEDVSVFAGLKVERVERIDEAWGRAPASMRGYAPSLLRGAVIVGVSQLSLDSAEARLRCRAARARAHGDDGTDPVAVHGATFRVREVQERELEIRIRADDEACAKEVLRRAEALIEH